MRGSKALVALALALTVLALTLAGCGGDSDDSRTNTRPAPSGAEGKGATSPSTGALPKQLVDCYADKGYKIESPAEIHSAPPQVIQECFAALHQGGGSP
jgi:hypothetical protein